jgi:hypothetical protein
MIKFYLSLFNAYRVLEYPGRLKISTITDPFKGTSAIDLSIYIPVFRRSLSVITKTSDVKWLEWVSNKLDNLKLFNIFKSSNTTQKGQSNFSTHPLAIVSAAATYNLYPNEGIKGAGISQDQWENPTNLRLTGRIPRQDNLRSNIGKAVELLEGYVNPRIMKAFIWFRDHIPSHINENIQLWYVPEGKLAPKFEPAGKIRIFAMVDSWTNWFMKPIHDLLFDQILPRIPQDGTFDQLAPVKALLKSKSYTGLYSLDLSAATDRLPATLQRDLLKELLDNNLANAWYGLMTDRHFVMAAKGLPVLESLKYKVGQPMGALSSWAMLAITHHFIVQASAWRSGLIKTGVWYKNYAVLGDDLVIGDLLVVEHYLKILKSLGVEVGIHKSLLSPKGLALEFAKRTFYKGMDVSPVPFKEVAAASLSIPSSIQFAKKYSLTLPKLLSAYGYGFRVLGQLNRPVGKLSSTVRQFVLQYKAMDLNTHNLLEFLSIGGPKRPRYVYDDWAMQMAFLQEEVQPLRDRIRGLITELAPMMNTRKIVKDTITQIDNYARGVDLILPYNNDLRDHLHSIVGATKVGPNALVKKTVMDMLARCDFLLGLQDLRVPFGNFSDMYFDVLYLREDIENLPLNDVRFVRVKEEESASLKDSVIPYHVKMWKKWGPYVQGTKALPSPKKETLSKGNRLMNVPANLADTSSKVFMANLIVDA